MTRLLRVCAAPALLAASLVLSGCCVDYCGDCGYHRGCGPCVGDVFAGVVLGALWFAAVFGRCGRCCR